MKKTLIMLLPTVLLFTACGKKGGGGGGGDSNRNDDATVELSFTRQHLNTLSEREMRTAYLALVEKVEAFTRETMPLQRCEGLSMKVDARGGIGLPTAYALSTLKEQHAEAPEGVAVETFDDLASYAIHFRWTTEIDLGGEKTAVGYHSQLGGNDEVLFGRLIESIGEARHTYLFEYARDTEQLTVRMVGKSPEGNLRSSSNFDLPGASIAFEQSGEEILWKTKHTYESSYRREGDAVVGDYTAVETGGDNPFFEPGSGAVSFAVDEVDVWGTCLRAE